MGQRLTSLALVAVLASLAVSCRHESTTAEGTSEIRMAPPKTSLVARASVFHGDKLVGGLRTFRFDDGTAREFTRVLDLREESLGYVTDDGRAYRYIAHGGENLVANSSDQRKNVAAVFGMPAEQFTIKTDK